MLAILIISVLLIAAAALLLRKKKAASLEAPNVLAATENLTASPPAVNVSGDHEPSVIVSPILLVSKSDLPVEEKPVASPTALEVVEKPPLAPATDKPAKTRKPTKTGIKDRPTKPTKIKAAKKNKKR